MSNTIDQKPALTGAATTADVTAVWSGGTTKKATPAQLLGDAVAYASSNADVVTSGTFTRSQMPGVRLVGGVDNELARFDLGLGTDVVLGDIVKQNDDRKFQLIKETPSSSVSWCEAPSYTDGETRVFNGGRAAQAVFEWARLAAGETTIAAYAATGSSVYLLGTDAYLDTPELATILTVSGDLTALDASACTSLTALTCSNNLTLATVDVSTCAALLTFDCQTCNLTSLDASACVVMTDLYCNGNSIATLDVSACAALTTLHCYDNSLSTLDVSACALLSDFDCHGNTIAALDVSACTALTTLYCYANTITSLNVSACPLLAYFDCHGNGITSLDVSTCTAMLSLSCYGNALTSLDVSACTVLETLVCSNNSLTTLNVSGLTLLGYMVCADNQLNADEVNSILATLDASGITGGTVDTSGNTAPTVGPPNGIAAAASLVGKSWAVTTD